MIYKILGSVLVIAAGVVAVTALKDGSFLGLSPSEPCVQLTPAQQFSQMIENDFKDLASTQQLPKQWGSIEKVEFRMNSILAKALLGETLPLFMHTENGENMLELEVMDLPDESNPGVIVQASLFDIKTKNKIFEIGRTYLMADLNKTHSQEKQDTK